MGCHFSSCAAKVGSPGQLRVCGWMLLQEISSKGKSSSWGKLGGMVLYNDLRTELGWSVGS